MANDNSRIQADAKRASLIMAGALILAALILVFFMRRGARPDVVVFIFERFFTIFIALLVVSGGMGFGLFIIRLWKIDRDMEPGEKAAIAAGIGVGAVAALVLLLGVMGLMQGWLWLAILIGMALLGGKDLKNGAVGLFSHVGASIIKLDFSLLIWVIIALVLLMNLAGGFVPAWEYDTLEYHLGAPAEYFRAGRIFYISDNVYASFPQNVENLYLVSMALNGSTRAGAQAGNIINILLAFIGTVGIRALGKRLYSPRAGDAAAAVFFLWPGITLYSGHGRAYVETALMFFIIVAFIALYHLLKSAERGPRVRWAIVCGLMVGFSIGCKYPAALQLMVPVGVLLGVWWLTRRKKISIAVPLIWFAAVLLAWSPWIIRNTAWTGNPTRPLLYSVFGGEDWDGAKDAKWTQAHAPSAVTFPGFFDRVGYFLFRWELAALSLILFIPFAALAGREKAVQTALLAGFLIFSFITWYCFTHQISRFLAPVIPAMALLSGAGVWLAEQMRGRAIAVTFLLVLLFEPARFVAYLNYPFGLGMAFGTWTEQQYFEEIATTDFADVYRATMFINDNLPENSKVLFWGEARTFYCERPFVAPTVFDDQPLERIVAEAESPEGIMRGLRAKGITHILVNADELIRLQDPTKAYGHEFEGQLRLGLLDDFNWELFEQFAQRHLETIEAFSGERNHPWSSYGWYEWDRLRRPWDEFRADYERLRRAIETGGIDPRRAQAHMAELQRRERELRETGEPPSTFVALYRIVD